VLHKRYQRLNADEKGLLRILTSEGKSLNQLVKLTGLNKTTIYYIVRGIKPPQWRKLEINLPEEKVGELIGAFAGDGNYYWHKTISPKHKITYCLSNITDKEYAWYISNLLKKLNLNSMIFVNKKQNRIDVTVNSKEFIAFIKRYLVWEKDKAHTIRLRNNVENYSNKFLIGFARGLMDTDGFLNEGNAICACISKRLIDNLDKIFKKFKIITSRRCVKRERPRRDLYYVRALREKLNNYNKYIGFSNEYKQKHLNRILKKK
jgi:hypothetical protein